MVSHRRLLATTQDALAGPAPTLHERSELLHMLHVCQPDFEAFLQYPAPKSSDRSQVLSKEVRLPDAPPTILDDQDTHIALKLSDDFYLNEVDCVRLLIASHQEWNLLGREPLEILRLAAGLWFTERRALITSLQLIVRAVVLDEELDQEFVADIRQYVEGLIHSGLRKRLIALIKELNREEPAGMGGPGVEPYVRDSRGSLVQRRDIAQKERLSLSQCLVLTCLVVRIDQQEVKDIFDLLKDCAADLNTSEDLVKLQITYTIMFALLIALMSDALGKAQDMTPVLSQDSSFQQEFRIQMTNSADVGSKGFIGVIRLAWAVFLMLNLDESAGVGAIDEAHIHACLDKACEQDVFKFITSNIIKTPAFENDDEDMVFVYNVYLHKLFTSMLSHGMGRDKVKELKDLAMVSLDSYAGEERDNAMEDDARGDRQIVGAQSSPFISLLELISEIYQKEPELVLDNEVLWNFVRFAGEEHSNYLTLAAFLNMLTALASSADGARRVYHILEGKTFRSVGWQTLFNSLNVYHEHFRKSLQTTGGLFSVLQEGDAKALEAYLRVLNMVMVAGDEAEKTTWFPDIEPLFKLLSYENVPTYLKGALRDAIATFVPLSSVLREKVWNLLQMYDLPIISLPALADGTVRQAYDMTFELNELEARQERYPSTISYLNLLNVLIENETNLADKGQRYGVLFRFVRDHVFGSYSQRAYADGKEKWKMVIASLRHFQMMLSMYHMSDEDIRSGADPAFQQGNPKGLAEGNITLPPAVELMKDLMSGKVIFRNIVSILMIGVNRVLEERVRQSYGLLLEEAIKLCLELVVLALSKDVLFADIWRPLYQQLDIILSHDNRQVVALLEYIRYDALPAIQKLSIQIMSVLSSRMPHLVSIIVESGSAPGLIEDYAVCLEVRCQESQIPEGQDVGALILRLLISNLDQPAPNISHLLLDFDIDQPVERTVLQPKRTYSCLRIVLDMLDTLQRPDINALLHELGFQLMHELSTDPITGAPTVELLRTEKYDFFSKHLEFFACEQLPMRSTNQLLRISSLQQRAWLLKLGALELHVSDMDIIIHRQSCRRLLGHLFFHENLELNTIHNGVPQLMITNTSSDSLRKMKVLELLDIVNFELPKGHHEFPPELDGFKDDLKVGEILSSSAMVDAGGIYSLSERGDRVIDLPAFRDKLWQEYKRLEIQYNLLLNEQRQAAVREAMQQLLRWAWKRNKALEEEAAQLHMLVGWCQLIEVALSRRFEFLGNQTQVLFDILDASLDVTLSSHCSLRMAFSLSHVILTSMAKLQEQSFTSPGEGDTADDVTYLDLLSSVRLSNSACHTILSKLVSAILRQESSEALRRRQYAALLTYFHYSQGAMHSDLSLSAIRSLLMEGQDGEEDKEYEKIDKEQTELSQINFTILKQDITALIDVVAKDATHGSEIGKAMAFYVLEMFLGLDRNLTFFSQLQSRGLLQGCLADVSKNSYQALLLPSRDMIRRIYTLEAELALLLRVCFHSRKRGAQALFAMGAMQHLSSCRAIDLQLVEDTKAARSFPSHHDRQHQIILPVLRLVLCITTLIDSPGSREKRRNEVALEVLEFVKLHHGIFERILRDDAPGVHLADLEELEVAASVLCRIWPLEDSEEFGFKQALFNLAYIYFALDNESRSRFVQHYSSSHLQTELTSTRESLRRMELLVSRLRCSLISFVHTLVSKQGMRLISSKQDVVSTGVGPYTFGMHRQPTLRLVSNLLQQATKDLDAAVEEKALIMSKLQDINELSRHEVDEIIKVFGRTSNLVMLPKSLSDMENIRKRRYLAMLEMCNAAGIREQQISSLILIVEHVLEVLCLHFESRLSQPQMIHVEVMDMTKMQEQYEELQSLSEKLQPAFEKIESIKEEKVGRNMKHLQRLIHTLRSQTVRKF